jgi:hypothetical protein
MASDVARLRARQAGDTFVVPQERFEAGTDGDDRRNGEARALFVLSNGTLSMLRLNGERWTRTVLERDARPTDAIAAVVADFLA